MSIRVPRKTLQRTVAIAALLAAATSLAGCSTFGMGGPRDSMTTGSTGYQGASNRNQPMPTALGQSTRVAEGPFVPPADVGDGGPAVRPVESYASLPPASEPSSISSHDLPVIGNASSNGNFPAMSAQPASQSLPPAYVTTPKANMASTATAPRPVSAVITSPRPAMPILAPAPTPIASVAAVSPGVYTHTIRSGESLYTIAKHYGVSAPAIMQASSISAPDKIFVGQRVVIPGRPDLLAAMDEPQLPADSAKLPVDSSRPVLAVAAPEPLAMHPHAAPSEIRVASIDNGATPVMPLAGRVTTAGPVSTLPPTHNALTGKPVSNGKPVAPAAAVTAPTARPGAPAAHPAAAIATAAPAPKTSAAPAQMASIAPPAAQQPAVKAPLQEPAMSGADKFRWPVNGKVIVDFASSHGTGINIAAPEGTPVKAAENGTVIYVGSGVEGYGNLILIRHANGFVSAYANLKDMGVAKGAVVNRGDVIGAAGTTGSVNSPQLHFELRKGATPVDPVPLLAG